ncbi:MAG: phosphatase PAP2 family protein [Paracoccaceae bacterium]|nr:phosphatase PAP2 family protein [Paracoccaceae bacterium]
MSGNGMTRILVVITIACAILFTVAPEIDLVLTRVFFENNGFWASTSTPLNQFRDILYGAVFAMLVTALVSWGFALCGRRLWSVPTRVWAFVSALVLIGPGLIVNSVLKAYWGRARPDDVKEFGGTMEFTPALIPSDQCPSNCSFVSGEGAGATALFIATAVLLPFAVAPKWQKSVLLLTGIICAFGIALRVMMGRHFLSDTVFAMLIVSLIALLLHRLIIGTKQTS